MKTSDVMTRSVVTIQPNAGLLDAIRLMLGQRISGLPVVDANGVLVGMLTEGDLLRRAETGTVWQRPQWLEFLRGPGRQAEDFVRANGRRVEDVMSRDVQCVTEDTLLDEVVALMEKRHFKRLPVLRDGEVVGVISRADLLRALAEKLSRVGVGAAVSDEGLRAAVEAALRRQPWAARGMVTIVVTDGVVSLEGVVFDEAEQAAIRVAVETVPGVKSVRDNLAFQPAADVGFITF